jgi:hypothetical protein
MAAPRREKTAIIDRPKDQSWYPSRDARRTARAERAKKRRTM